MAFSLARFHVAMSIWNILSPFNFMFWGFVFWACTLWKMVDPWIHLCWLVSKKWHRHHSAGQPLNLDPAKVVRNKSRSSIFPSSLSLLYYIYIHMIQVPCVSNGYSFWTWYLDPQLISAQLLGNSIIDTLLTMKNYLLNSTGWTLSVYSDWSRPGRLERKKLYTHWSCGWNSGFSYTVVCISAWK